MKQVLSGSPTRCPSRDRLSASLSVMECKAPYGTRLPAVILLHAKRGRQLEREGHCALAVPRPARSASLAGLWSAFMGNEDTAPSALSPHIAGTQSGIPLDAIARPDKDRDQ
jgi:hypothetical protein